jgi:hypothetical protein
VVSGRSCACLAVLSAAVFPDARGRLDFALGLACIPTGFLGLLAALPPEPALSWWLAFLGTGLCHTVGGVILVVLTRKLQLRGGGGHAHT